MSGDGKGSRAAHMLLSIRNLCVCSLAVVGLSAFSITPVAAQQDPIIRKGDAVVTGYSGVALLQPAAKAKPIDYAIINPQGASLQVFDLSQMNGPADARLIDAPRSFSVTADKIGQVFGVALDDGKDDPRGQSVPNIYATATSMFGLQLVKTAKGVRNRARSGGANRSWMGGQFGITLGGGPGSIWKINGRTGEVTLFANVELNGTPNSGPALGNIAFDRRSRKLFVSDLQTGMIHAYDLSGREVDLFDHGAKGRPRLGLPAIDYDPTSRVEMTSQAFNATKPSTWGFAEAGRQVWGLAVSSNRLYYSVAEGPEIWSVGVRRDGTFSDDARVEIEVSAASKDPVSDITFGRDGTLYLSQRGQAVSSYDYTVLAKSKTASVLRYTKRKLSSGRLIWQRAPDEYAVGFPDGYRNANGGVALGYGYDRYGFMRSGACEQTLWSTGERLRENAKHKSRLTSGGPTVVHGLQGNRTRLVRPDNEAPFETYFIDFDNTHADPTFQGHMGDVSIWSSCPGAGSPAPTGGPTTYWDDDEPDEPTGPWIRISKKCSPASFGGQMLCSVTLVNRGSGVPSGRVSFNDIATVLTGSAGGGGPLIISATTDDASWQCSALPANNLRCSIAGDVLEPGHRHTVQVVMNISGLSATPNWRFRNCARLKAPGQKSKRKCVTRGQSNSLIVTKSGPLQGTCIAGGPCDFTLTVTNPGNRTFSGPVLLADNLSISGANVGGISVDGVSPSHGCNIIGGSLPLQWQCPMTIPPGGSKTFTMLLTIPVGAGPAAGGATGRNCFVATNPGLALVNGALPISFWPDMLNPASPANAPGQTCISFSIQAPQPNQIIPPRVIGPGLPPSGPWGPPILPGQQGAMQLVVTATPNAFTNAGEMITFSYIVSNIGNVPIQTFKITDNKVIGPNILSCPINTGIGVGSSITCTAPYKIKPADLGTNIISNATVTGTW